jgi:hypothetical protein
MKEKGLGNHSNLWETNAHTKVGLNWGELCAL